MRCLSLKSTHFGVDPSFFCDFDGCCLSEEWSPALARGRRCACINAMGGKTNAAIARCAEIPALLKVKKGFWRATLYSLASRATGISLLHLMRS